MLVAIKKHLDREKVSFHTPGHKGRLDLNLDSSVFLADLTELPGLDELAKPGSVLLSLQARIAEIYGAKESFISVNGASAALTTALLASCFQGQKIMLPRNVHRSALNALSLSGAEPIWYEAEWLDDWQTWGAPSAENLDKLAEKEKAAAVLVLSPNYAGVRAELDKFSAVCKKHGMILIVDEAHGAHSFKSDGSCDSALQYGADFVVHSLHKTLRAPTQTGVLHLGPKCKIEPERVRAIMNSLQSSSPSYLLMLGIEKSIEDLASFERLKSRQEMAEQCFKRIGQIDFLKILDSDRQDRFHLLIKHKSLSAGNLEDRLIESGIFPETILGDGVLLMLGLGTETRDIDTLISFLSELAALEPSYEEAPSKGKLPALKQVLNPRKAFFAQSELAEIRHSAGKIACDWLAPCPPGYPLIAPGQLIEESVISFVEEKNSIRVVRTPAVEGDSDGTNTAS